MATIAKWGSMEFMISPTKIMALENFSTSVELKADSENDTSGTSPTNTRGFVARPVSFSVTYTRAAGVDPRSQLEQWEGQVGKSNPLYIGGSRFGPASLMLNKADSSNYVFSPKGDILSVTINLSFVENTGGSKSSTAKKKSTASSSKAGSVYADTVAKQKAMNATASTNDRNTKKLTAKEKRLSK